MEFNLSAWALKHRSFVVYCMIASSLAGAFAFYRLGRAEDPPFTIRTMVVRAVWPGATIDETLLQVTERLERTLEETPHLDFLRSFTKPGVTTIFVNLKGATTGREVDDTWYHVRKSVADMRHTLPPGVVGPFFDDEFGDTFGIIYGLTADGFTHRELRDYAEDIRSRLLHVPDVHACARIVDLRDLVAEEDVGTLGQPQGTTGCSRRATPRSPTAGLRR
jgi:multidrug efflux pump subunit AcrB